MYVDSTAPARVSRLFSCFSRPKTKNACSYEPYTLPSDGVVLSRSRYDARVTSPISQYAAAKRRFNRNPTEQHEVEVAQEFIKGKDDLIAEIVQSRRLVT